MNNGLDQTISSFVDMINGEWSQLSITMTVGDTPGYYPADVYTVHAGRCDEKDFSEFVHRNDDSIRGLSAEGWTNNAGHRLVKALVLTEWPED